MSSKKITVKKKNSVVKTLQWIGISVISILLILYFNDLYKTACIYFFVSVWMKLHNNC